MELRVRILTTVVALTLSACSAAPASPSGSAKPPANAPATAVIDSLPEATSRTPPIMPVEALAKRQDGFVVVELDLRTDGSVSAARVLESMPPGLYDKSALAAVMQWRFQPTLVDGVAVARTITQRLDFVLSGK